MLLRSKAARKVSCPGAYDRLSLYQPPSANLANRFHAQHPFHPEPGRNCTPVYSAENWFREILDADAFDGPALQMLVDCLWKREKWGDASMLLRTQLALRGNLPGL